MVVAAGALCFVTKTSTKNTATLVLKALAPGECKRSWDVRCQGKHTVSRLVQGRAWLPARQSAQCTGCLLLCHKLWGWPRDPPKVKRETCLLESQAQGTLREERLGMRVQTSS